MFNNKQPPQPAPAASQQVPPKQASSKVPSIISFNMTLRGEFSGGGDLQIEGQVIGRIDTDHLVITETGVVEGDVVAKAVAIAGTLRGTIHAANVTLSSTAKVQGDVLHEVLTVEAGALIEGQCKRITPPAEDAVLKLTEDSQVQSLDI